MILRTPRRLAAAVVATALCAGLAACGDDENTLTPTSNAGASDTATDTATETRLSGTVSGAGASSQAAAMEAWIAAFTDQHSGVTINYEPTGSGAGREQFSAGAIRFAGSDAPLQEDELTKAKSTCVDVIQIPVYVSPIAIAFNLDGVEELNLKAETVAKIFDQKITRWNDAAIAADNPDVELPDLEITPVNRSDESGTTENFTEYLHAAAPDAWPHEPSGDWPVSGGEAAQGTSGVIGAISAGEGTIGYADASQAGELGQVSVAVGEDFVGPSPEAAASILGASERVADSGEFGFVYELDRATDEAGTYPVVLVSYALACTKYGSQGDVDLVKAFLGYILSEEGQKTAQEAAGSAPLSAEQRTEFSAAIDAIGLK
ncbi:phosphate ABC transporter substrate-binding protein PstS [Sporichthya polymorpha]|uniref:phosphate ABC transporter substrate-binding protein PstS n=1 Tax=Sporichthya polymorpha TaxID=35751 RepID=UPI000380C99B|nr:phosphate ABC transporter substrate-binding protein PstS [Sporichthya polymorpha]